MSKRLLRKLAPNAPACQLNPNIGQDTEEICQVLILDADNNALITKESLHPRYRSFLRWGLPKGHILVGETSLGCAHREVCEEVGIEIEKLPHRYADLSDNLHLIQIQASKDDIPVITGPEIKLVKWVLLPDLKRDVFMDAHKLKQSKIRGYSYRPKYNWSLRNVLKKL